MLTRFRIEATGKTRNEVQDELLKVVGQISKVIRTQNGQTGHWVCTDDVIHLEKPFRFPSGMSDTQFAGHPDGDKEIYKGRMVMTYRGWNDAK